MQYPALCLENLSIDGLAKTKLAKSMLDAAFGQVIEQWKYKSLWNGTHALQADRFFPSTQLCSHGPGEVQGVVVGNPPQKKRNKNTHTNSAWLRGYLEPPPRR